MNDLNSWTYIEFIKDKCSCLSFLSPSDDFIDGLGISGSDASVSLSASGMKRERFKVDAESERSFSRPAMKLK